MIIVVVYVHDIIFGGINDNMCKIFATHMQDEFELSMLGELSFFLGLQIVQTKNGIFISQKKYGKEMLKKFGMEDSRPVNIRMITSYKLTKSDESLDAY